jgi:hypothetical protein
MEYSTISINIDYHNLLKKSRFYKRKQNSKSLNLQGEYWNKKYMFYVLKTTYGHRVTK